MDAYSATTALTSTYEPLLLLLLLVYDQFELGFLAHRSISACIQLAEGVEINARRNGVAASTAIITK